MKRVTVAVATRNRLFCLHQLLWSLRNQDYPYWDLIIVDDSEGPFNIESWEKDEMYKRIIAELRKSHKVQILASPKTSKVGAVLQEGFLWAEKNWRNPLFCRADDDHWLNTDYFSKMVKVFDDDKIACAASLVLDPGADIQSLAIGDERRQTWGKVATIANTPNLQWIRHESPDLIDVEHLTCPMIMRTDRLREIGGFDTHLFDHFREESFHSWRFHVEGHRVVIVPTAEVWHLRAPSGGVRGQGNALDDARKFNLVRKDMQPGIHLNLTHACGDLIASTPMFEQLRKKHPGRNISVWHPLAKDIFEGNPNIDVICKSALSDQRTHRVELSVYGYMGKNDWRGSLANAYCKALDLNELDNPSPALYNVEPMGEIENYIIVANNSSAKIYDFSDFSRTKHLEPISKWDSIIQELRNKYNCEVIQLSGAEVVDPLQNVRLVNNVNYRDAFRWLKGARCVLSIDTMAAHAAAGLDVPAVVLFGRSDASMYGYNKKNIVNLQGMCPKGQSKPCNGGVMFQQDKRTCPLPGHPCMNHSIEEIMDAVNSVIIK